MSPMFHTARRRVHPSLVLSAATVVLFTVAMLVPITKAKAETTGLFDHENSRQFASPLARRR